MLRNSYLCIVVLVLLGSLTGCNGSSGSSTGVDSTTTRTASPAPVSSLSVPSLSNSLTSTPAISWIGSSSSNILRYEYCIGLSAGSCTTLGWTGNSLNNTVTATGLNLTDMQVYYVNVRAIDNANNISTIQSASWTVDLSYGFTCNSIHSYNSGTASSDKLFANPTLGIYGYNTTNTSGTQLRRFKVSDSSDTLIADNASLGIATSWNLSSWAFDRVTGNAYVLITSDMTRRVRKVDLATGTIDTTIPDFSLSATLENSLENKIDVNNGKIVVASHYKKILTSAGYIKVNTYNTSWTSATIESYLPTSVSVVLSGVSGLFSFPFLISSHSYNGPSRWTVNGSGTLPNGNTFSLNDSYSDPTRVYNYSPTLIEVSSSQAIVAGQISDSGGSHGVIRSYGIDGGSSYQVSSYANISRLSFSSTDSTSLWLLSGSTVAEINANTGTQRRGMNMNQQGSYQTTISDIFPVSKDEFYALATVQQTNGGDNFVHILRCGYY